MKKFINNPDDIISEMIGGFIGAFGEHYYKLPDYNGIIYKNKKDKVSVVTGGGSCGEPWCIGACGEGMADGVAVGNVAAAPAATIISAVCNEVFNEKGILLIVANHMGDYLNFELGRELFALENDAPCELVLVTDDITTAPKTERKKRRALTGMPIVTCLASATANAELPLSEVRRIAEKTNESLSTVSAILDMGINPASGYKMGEIPAGECHIGTGISGEPGNFVMKPGGEKEVTEKLIDMLSDDLDLNEKYEIALFINGMGNISVMEELVICNTALSRLKSLGINVYDVDLTEKVKVQETKGVAISILKLDDELKKYYGERVHTPLINKNQRFLWTII